MKLLGNGSQPNTDRVPSFQLANEMMESAAKAARELQAQREEILTAFVAKYGFQPDECEQIVDGNRWFVVRLDPERVKIIQRDIIRFRLDTVKFTWWQRFCLWCARY